MDHVGALETLVARQQVHDCLMRYARGVDRRDRAEILRAFHADAVDDHGVVVTPEQFADAVMAGPIDRTYFHLIGNVFIEFLRSDAAMVESYFVACHYYEEEGEMRLRVRCGRYIDRFERRDVEWRIAHRVVVDDWNRLDVVDLIEPLRQPARSNGLFPNDPVYRMRKTWMSDASE